MMVWSILAYQPEIKKLRHNTKDTMTRLLERCLPPEGFVLDPALAAYLLAPTDGSYELDSMVKAMGSMASHADALNNVLPAKLEEFGLTRGYRGPCIALMPGAGRDGADRDAGIGALWSTSERL